MMMLGYNPIDKWTKKDIRTIATKRFSTQWAVATEILFTSQNARRLRLTIYSKYQTTKRSISIHSQGDFCLIWFDSRRTINTYTIFSKNNCSTERTVTKKKNIHIPWMAYSQSEVVNIPGPTTKFPAGEKVFPIRLLRHSRKVPNTWCAEYQDQLELLTDTKTISHRQ